MNVQSNGLEIAIIGLSGRFPGSQTIEAFWENLQKGVESISVFPNSAQPLKPQVEPSDRPQNHSCRGGILTDIDQFDAVFFGFNPREAETIDPQHRLFLECAWQSLENAGYNTETEERPIGVFAGVGMGTYLLHNLSPNPGLLESRGFLQTLVGVDKDYLSSRVSYKLNLTGPSVSVGTACSSALVAVHLACQSLLSGECDMAVAAGVAVKVPQNELTLSPGEIVSPDGHCRAFDARANGTVGGNGVGAVVLKRLEDAIGDRDTIYAVIKGSAINNDGGLKVGYTAPSQEGQAKVIRAAQIMADVPPETITYIETHGTGTPLGDPIEIAAMTEAFRVSTAKTGYCAIGSVKTNVGHLDAAAGIAGLIKTVLVLHHKVLPPSLNFATPNPKIDFANSPFYVSTELTEWTDNGVPRRAGVSSFGFGGTNAHMILEEAPPKAASSPSRPQQLLLLSAKTRAALNTATANLIEHLQRHPDRNLADVAYTLQVGRQAFEHRRMVVAANLESAGQALASDSPPVLTQLQESDNRPVVWMFTGQGAQYVNMARELYQYETTFREVCDQCCELLHPQLGYDLRQVIYPNQTAPNQITAEQATQQLQQTATTQPALFVIEYALAQLWMSWGIEPAAMIGHSIGEYVAACLAGVFSLEEALSLVVIRGQLMQSLPGGAMLSVGLSAAEVQPLLGTLLGTKLSIAASNSPKISVVSGSIEAIAEFEHHLIHQGVTFRRLHTSHAFHSEMMDAVLEPFTLAVKKVCLNPPQIPFISNVTGTWITAAEATDPDYWARHLRQTVRFAEGITELLQDAEPIFLEVGPGGTLSRLTQQQAPDRVVLASLRHPKDQQSDVAFLLNTLGQLWLAGVRVNWTRFYQNEQRDRLPLPTYPFERQRYWIDPPAAVPEPYPIRLDKKSSKSSDLTDWFYVPSWKQSMLPIRPLPRTQLPETTKSSHLIFIDQSGLGMQLVKRLEQQGQSVVTVKVGSAFAQVSEDVYVLNPGQKEDYDTLLKHLMAQQKVPHTIVHLWTVTPDGSARSGLAEVETIQEQGFYSLLFLAQALGQQNLTDQFHITIVSNQMQSVTGDEPLHPEKATLLGPVNVIIQEYPNLHCCSIDIVLPAPESWQAEKLIDQLLNEIMLNEITTSAADPIVAYRGINRWVRCFEPIQLDSALEETPGLKQGGVYLITGGLGGIGLVLAEHLARTVQAKLILLGRSALPDRSQWADWIATHDETERISRKLRCVLELEDLGAEVLVISADVDNLEQMQRAIGQAQVQFGSINGVIHAAGMPGGGIIQRKTRQDAERVLAPKVKGTLVLDTLLQTMELDFFVLCSSLASTIGMAGQVDYSAANAFLDAFAHYKTTTSNTLTTCINWDTWQEVGMAVSEQFESSSEGSIQSAPIRSVSSQPTATPIGFSEEFLKQGLFPSEGIQVFRRILGSRLPQVLVSTRDLLQRIDQYNTDRDTADRDTFNLGDFRNTIAQTHPSEQPNRSQSAHPRPALSHEYVPPRNEIEQTIAHVWQTFLGINQVGIHDSFFELGGHSLLATQVIAKMGLAVNMSLSLDILFDQPTVAKAAEYIEQMRCTAQTLQAPIPPNSDDRTEIEL